VILAMALVPPDTGAQQAGESQDEKSGSEKPPAAAQAGASAEKAESEAAEPDADAQQADEDKDGKAKSDKSEPLVPVEEFLRSSAHPVLVSISADTIVYSSDRKLLYARGNVRYSGRGFVIAAEVLRLDLDPQRALLSSVRGVLRKGHLEKSFQGDVLRLDMQQRRAVLTTYGDRIVVERLWFPEPGEVQTTEQELYFDALENLPIEADLGRILEERLYLEFERVKIDPESRLRAWGVVPYIEGEPGPRLPYFSFRTGAAQPRQGFSLRSLGASNTSGIRADAAYSVSPAERLMTTFELRYEELSLLKDPFRPKRRARFGLTQDLTLSEPLEAELGGFYQTDEQWEAGARLELQQGPTTASIQGLLQNDPITGRHNRLRIEHVFDKEQLHSDLLADLDLGTQLDLHWDFNAKLWKDRLSFQGTSSYLKRFERGIYQPAEVFSESAFASLTLSGLVTSLAYTGIQDLTRGQNSHYPTVSVEMLPQSLGAGFLLGAGNQVQMNITSGASLGVEIDPLQVNDEVWASLQHTPIYFTDKLSYDARVRVAQRFLEGIDDETTLEALATLTRMFGQVSSTALSYRYLTVRQTSSNWLTVGQVIQEAQATAQLRLDRTKQLFGQARYSISDNKPLDTFVQFTGDFGPMWKTTFRSGFDFQRNRFNVLDVSVARDMFFGWMKVTYRQVQNELTVEYTAKLF
jgi:hypothetical protein